MEPVARSLMGDRPPEAVCAGAYHALRRDARGALVRIGPLGPDGEWATPDVHIGWWCAECGNVDAPQPCLGVCIWRPTEWVNAALYDAEYERCAEDLRSAGALARMLRTLVSVTPKPERCGETLDAFQTEAVLALGDVAD